MNLTLVKKELVLVTKCSIRSKETSCRRTCSNNKAHVPKEKGKQHVCRVFDAPNQLPEAETISFYTYRIGLVLYSESLHHLYEFIVTTETL